MRVSCAFCCSFNACISVQTAWNSSFRRRIFSFCSASSDLARSNLEFNSAFRICTCSSMVSRRSRRDLTAARSFNALIMAFLPVSILVLYSSMTACIRASSDAASSLSRSTWAAFSSVWRLSSRMTCLSFSLAQISPSTVSLRFFRWFSLPWAERICSLSTFISPSSFPRITLVSVIVWRAFSMVSSSCSNCCSICPYSSFICSYVSVVSCSSPSAMRYFSSTVPSCSRMC